MSSLDFIEERAAENFEERFRDTRYIFMVSVRTACRHKVYADPLSDKLKIN